jgi:glycosyltransferase involved in cell wall biosynthesis
LLIASFGFITPGKGLESALSAFDRFVEAYPDSRYFLVGEAIDPGYPGWLLRHLRRDHRDKLIITGYVSGADFSRYLAAADICVNLRYPSQGEASSILMRLLAMGKTVLIPWYRQFMEIPRNACIHIDLTPDEGESIYQAFTSLAENPDLMRSIGRNASGFIREHHHVDVWASKMIEMIDWAMNHRIKVDSLAERCDLRFVRSMRIEEQIALTMGDWKLLFENEHTVEALTRAVMELGLDR